MTSTEMIPDHALLEQMRPGCSVTTLEEVIRRHERMVLRTAQRIVGNGHDAEEITQLTFFKFFKEAHTVHENVAGWLHRVACNLSCDRLKANQRRARREREVGLMYDRRSTIDIGELREEVDAALVRLPSKLQEAVLLRYLAGYSQEEAASIVGCPRTTFKTRCEQGLEHLRKLLERRTGKTLSAGMLSAFLVQEAAAAQQVTVGGPAVILERLSSTSSTYPMPGWRVLSYAWFKLGIAIACPALGIVLAALMLFVGKGEPAAVTPTTYELELLLTLRGHDSGVQAVAYHPSGNLIATASSDHVVRLWDTTNGREIARLDGHPDPVHALAFSADGDLLASGSGRWQREAQIRIWRVVNRKEALILHGQAGEVTSLSFSPDGKHVASADWEGVITLWNASNGQELAALRGHKSGVWSVRFTPDGRLLSCSNDGTIRVWDVNTMAAQDVIHGHGTPIHSMSLSADGRTLVSSSGDRGRSGQIRVWNWTEKKTTLIIPDPSSRVYSVAINPIGDMFASGTMDGVLSLEHPLTGASLTSLKGHRLGVCSMVFSPDGTHLLTGSWDSTAKLWIIRKRF